MDKTNATEGSQATLQREIDAEVRRVNKMLRKEMDFFVSGLHVAVQCILAAIDAVRDRHLEDNIQTPASEEERDTQPSPKAEEGDKPEAEQEELLEQTQEEEEEENDISSELMKSLSNTLDDLKHAEDMVFDMDYQEHDKAEAGQLSGDSFCYLEFMSEFLPHFRQNILESCQQFLSMAIKKLTLLHMRKELKDPCLNLSSSPSKAITPRVSSMVTAASRTTAQRINVEASTPSSTETGLKINGSEDSIPSYTADAQNNADLEDKTSSKTRSAATEESITEDTPSVDANAAPQTGDSNTTTPPEPKESTQQCDDKGTSQNMMVIPQKDELAASVTEVTPVQNSPETQVVLDNDVFDFVSPQGMTLMFGNQYEDSKISFLPPSPVHQPTD